MRARRLRASAALAVPTAALLTLGAVPSPASAQQSAPAAAAAAPRPRDSTPAESYFGVTEYQLARQKLEQDMQRDGFTVYIIADMEGLAAAVRNATEMRPAWRNGSAEHERFRVQLTDEVNAVIAGARAAGATQFVVNDGHGGTLFRNTLPDLLDEEAILIRGYPKPIVMSTGLNPEIDALMIVGAHANQGSPGVIAHNFAFDSFTVNGKVLNEAGIAAFIGGEMGIPFVLASGDDALTSETREMLGPIETVTTKLAVGRSAAITLPVARVNSELRAAAERAVRRVKSGELRPLRLDAPYRVRFCMRRSYDDWVRSQVAKIEGLTPDGGPGCFAYTSRSAEDVGNLLNIVEWIVLKP